MRHLSVLKFSESANHTILKPFPINRRESSPKHPSEISFILELLGDFYKKAYNLLFNNSSK